jgi:hypothetical protein
MEQKHKRFNVKINITSDNLEQINEFFKLTKLPNQVEDFKNHREGEQHFAELHYTEQQLEIILQMLKQIKS